VPAGYAPVRGSSMRFFLFNAWKKGLGQMKMAFLSLPAALLVLLAVAGARGDEVILKNGDKINGTVGEVTGDSMKFTSPVLGDLTIKLSNVQSYTTDHPATVRLKSGQTITSPIVQADAAQIVTQPHIVTLLSAVKSINPPPEAWTGAVVVNGALARGNTNTATLGASANAVLRRDDPFFNDRFTLGGDYNYGNTGRGSQKTTTTDNADALFKYDRFFTPRFYGYGDIGYNHDRVANLDVRVTPGLGVGYQWLEKPSLNFSTEGGATYVYEDFSNDGNDQKEDFRAAYHLDSQLNPKVKLFHDTEYLAAAADPSDYLLNSDVGIRADLVKNFFAQFKVVYKRNDRPAPDALKDDLAFLLGVGWAF
jgi:putative salt-induced outer membrane protein YdiY